MNSGERRFAGRELNLRIRILISIATFVFLATVSLSLNLRAQSTRSSAKSATTADQQFDPHDLTGPWIGDGWGSQVGPGRGPGGLRNYVSFDQSIPEPPLTEWAKQHLLYKSISHDALAGTHLPGWDRPGHVCPSTQDPCYSKDPYGVPANDLDGEYPARDCEPLSTPAIYDYPGLGETEFTPTQDGTRIYQLFEYHHEWRTFWLNRDHPKGDDLDPTFEGDSIAHWEGNTLVVDTLGYNGKTMLSQNIGHSKSDAFHLVERIRRLDYDNLVIDMTYYDPKAWGDKSWPGFQKYYHRAPKEGFREFICSPREYERYEHTIISPEDESLKAIQGK
jgi:hypothetical protein